MPKLTIDNREIEVPPQTKLIEAAEQLGIMIPRFCYHPALGSVGACRVCAVKLAEGPLKGIQMSCMVEAQEGMVVSTTDEEAEDFRKYVIEWLMVNHPHDCPVCDEGGHCLLQDMTVSGGHGIRRYPGSKRTYADQYLGPLLQHEMNRCIHCYRCARYYQEFTGYRDLGVMQIASRTYYGRFQDGILESPFSGNLSDICPTGVYTDKPSRYFGRRWDYERSPCVCINCSLGCRTVASARYREVRRQEAHFSEAVNGYFICDRGRFGFFYAGLETRPRRATINDEEVALDEALQTVKQKLMQISDHSGPSSIATAGSLRSSLETQAALARLCQDNGWRQPVFFMEPAIAKKVKTSIARLEPRLVVSLREVEKADFILAIGADPVNEAPMLALAMRQAQRNGARIVTMDPRPIELPFENLHLPCGLDNLSDAFGAFIKASVGRETAATLGKEAEKLYDLLPDENIFADPKAALINAALDHLKKSRRPVVVCGTDVVPEEIPGLGADLALLLQAADKKAGLFYLMPGANAFGAGLLGDSESSFLEVIEEIEKGQIKSLILAESDPFFHFPNRKRWEQALDKLDLLIVLDYIHSDTAQKAHIFLPSATLYETDGLFINQEGRVQATPMIYEGGTPISQTGRGDHPPRIYGEGLPGADSMPAGLLLAGLANGTTKLEETILPTDIYQWLADVIPELADLRSVTDIPDAGLRLKSGVKTELRFASATALPSEKHKGDRDSLNLILVDWTFGTEELSSYSACLHELEMQSAAFIQTESAEELSFSDGQQVSIQTESGSLEVRLKVVENMAPGVLVIPRHRKMAWQIFETGISSIGLDQFKKMPT